MKTNQQAHIPTIQKQTAFKTIPRPKVRLKDDLTTQTPTRGFFLPEMNICGHDFQIKLEEFDTLIDIIKTINGKILFTIMYKYSYYFFYLTQLGWFPNNATPTFDDIPFLYKPNTPQEFEPYHTEKIISFMTPYGISENKVTQTISVDGLIIFSTLFQLCKIQLNLYVEMS